MGQEMLGILTFEAPLRASHLLETQLCACLMRPGLASDFRFPGLTIFKRGHAIKATSMGKVRFWASLKHQINDVPVFCWDKPNMNYMFFFPWRDFSLTDHCFASPRAGASQVSSRPNLRSKGAAHLSGPKKQRELIRLRVPYGMTCNQCCLKREYIQDIHHTRS